MRAQLLTALVITSMAGCDAGFEDRSIVIDLRTLAVQVEPPEVVDDFDPTMPLSIVIPEVTVTAMVADPTNARRLEYEMTICPPTDSLRCDDADAPSAMFASGLIDDPESAAATPIQAAFTASLLILQESVRIDDLAGFGGVAVQVSLEVWPEGASRTTESAFAAKRMLFAPRIPAQRVANNNPNFAELETTANDVLNVLGPDRCAESTTPLQVAPDTRVELKPVEPDGIRENYVLPTFDGGVLMLTEVMRYAWFTTAGTLKDATTGGPTDAFGNLPLTRTFWTAPPASEVADLPGGLVQLWVVQRDDRGGAHWNEYCFKVML